MAQMMDVGDRPATKRQARAMCRVRMQAGTLRAIVSGEVPKGDVLQTAKIAGITGAKQCAALLPLCHPLPLDSVRLDIVAEEPDGLSITAECSTRAATGVEMEALTACSAAALCVYDMCKALDPAMCIEQTMLLEKSGGRNGLWRRED